MEKILKKIGIFLLQNFSWQIAVLTNFSVDGKRKPAKVSSQEKYLPSIFEYGREKKMVAKSTTFG